MRWVALLLGLAVPLLAASGQAQNGPRQAAPAAAERPLVRIGVVPALTVTETIQQYQPILDYLNQRLAADARLQPQKDYATVLEKMREGELEAGIVGSFIGWRAIREIGAIPLARPDRDGVSTYEGFVFVRKDSGIRDISGLRGKTFAYVDRDTSAGYVYPRRLLSQKGYDPDRFFEEARFTGKHDAAVLMVLNRMADGGAAKDDVYLRLERQNPRVRDELVVLHRSDARFPDRTLLVRKGFDPALAQEIGRALAAMHQGEAGRRALAAAGFSRYLATEAADFRALDRMLR